MTWFKFLLWLAGGYAVYYLILIGWDLLRSKKVAGQETNDVLTFVEDIAPQKPVVNEVADSTISAIVSSGGVMLKEIFRLAQEEAIEYIRPVSF